MEPQDAFKERPLYEWNQVITEDDLRDSLEYLLIDYNNTPVIYILERDRLMVAIKTIDTLLDWLCKGKPADYRNGI